MPVIPALEDGEQKVFFKAGGEWCYLWTPMGFKRDRPIPVVIHHHGARGYVREEVADWLEEERKLAYLRSVMEGGGCAIAGSHACGDHWGNVDAVAANAALFEALEASPQIDTSRTGLMGGGLGGVLVWNSVLGPLAGKIRAVVVMQAVASLEAVIREGKFKAPCFKAYNLFEDMPDEEAIARIAPHDPLPRIQRLAPGTPLPRVAIYHGARDVNIPAASSAIPLAEALRKAGGNVELEVFPDVEHNVYGMGRPIEERLNAFYRSNL
ncbi:MAG: prolyl oligopeptidase family serine peptidase [Candidatus Bathyarchaeota archaeon]|nr:MAG: prolyl oligopeptidase family serine peptidase [Candidatus Bathyarchaeota archaeon]